MLIKVILNPSAGRGKAAKEEAKICHALQKAGIDFDIVHTKAKGDGILLAKQARWEGYEIIAVAGGDGTVNEVINGLAAVTDPEKSVGTLAVLPVGTGNDLASCLGGNGNWQKLASAIAFRQTRYIDLGHIEIQEGTQKIKRFFHNYVGIGFNAKVLQKSQKIKHLRGAFIYLAAIFVALPDYYQPHVNVKWQLLTGSYVEISKKLLGIDILNSPRTGGGFTLAPNAVLDDGLLDVVIGDGMPWYQVLTSLLKVITKNHVKDAKIILQQTSRILVNCSEELPISADGELLTTNGDSVDIQVQHQRLQVICY